MKAGLRTNSNKVIVINHVNSFQANAKPISTMLGTSNINLAKIYPSDSLGRCTKKYGQRGVVVERDSVLLCQLETSQI